MKRSDSQRRLHVQVRDDDFCVALQTDVEQSPLPTVCITTGCCKGFVESQTRRILIKTAEDRRHPKSKNFLSYQQEAQRRSNRPSRHRFWGPWWQSVAGGGMHKWVQWPWSHAWPSALAAMVLCAQAEPSSAEAAAVVPPLQLLCTIAPGSDLRSPLATTPAPAAASGVTPEEVARARIDRPVLPSACSNKAASRGALSGSGDVFVVVSRKSWDQAMAAAPQANLRPRLFIDGISAGNDGALVGVEMSEGGTVNLRFHVATDKTTRNLWAAMYRDRPMTSPAPLRASLGWDSVPNTFPADASSPSAPTIQVTTPLREYVAFGAIAILGAFFLWCLRGSDVFRDHPSQPQPPTLSRNGSKPRARVVRATYSLARVQTGLWLFFIVAAGLFMWLVLGELPAAEPTLVGLLGLSAVTTSVSIAVDGNAGGRPFKPSERFLTDLVTGWDGTQQLHRIQALVVNGLLLVVGLEAVVQNLSYPIFDGTWLALLGVSAVAQTMGKQALESNLKLGSAANPGSGGTQGAPAAVPAGRKV